MATNPGLRPVVSAPTLGAAFVEPTQTTGEVAIASLRRHGAALLGLIEIVRTSFDPEALHDARVATRRARAALAVFKDALPSRGERLRRELGWLAGLLGSVRDLDVLLARLAADEPESEQRREARRRLIEYLEQRRTTARARLTRGLATKRFERLSALLIDVAQSNPPRRPEAARPILLAGPGLLEVVQRRVADDIASLGTAPPDDALHRLRIHVKRLRYTVEFLAPVYGEPSKQVIARTTRAQDVLGEHQDACVATQTLQNLAVSARIPNESIFEAGRIAERWTADATRARRVFLTEKGRLSGKRWNRLWNRALSLKEETAALTQPRTSPAEPPAPTETAG